MRRFSLKSKGFFRIGLEIVVFTSILTILYMQFTYCSEKKIINKKMEYLNLGDSVPRPPFISSKAVLINLGDDSNPIYTWVQYLDKYKYKGINYNHIYSFSFYYLPYNRFDTAYYECFWEREKKMNIDFDKGRIDPFPGLGTIDLITDIDTISFFKVLEHEDLTTEYNSLKYRRINKAMAEDGRHYSYSGEVQVNVESGSTDFKVSFYETGYIGRVFRYKKSGNFKNFVNKISFIDSSNGNIYFIGRQCHIEPVEDQDIIAKLLQR